MYFNIVGPFYDDVKNIFNNLYRFINNNSKFIFRFNFNMYIKIEQIQR